jgi:hypothetical protein
MGRGKLSSPESGFADEPHVGEVRAPARPPSRCCRGPKKAPLDAQLAALQVSNTVRADSMGNGGPVIPKKRRHVLLQ